MKTGTELRSDLSLKIDLHSENCPNTEFNMSKFITISLEELSSATIKFDV